MNFDLTEEQLMLQNTVSQAMQNECPVTHLRTIFDGESGHDGGLWKTLSELGVVGLAIPEEYGGAGLEILDLAVTAETLGYHAAPGPFLAHALAALAIAEGGSPEQKEKWLPGLASGDRIGTVALAEAGGLWQPNQWQMVAGDAISGVKKFVPFAELADLMVVGVAGGQLAVVEKDAPGISMEKVDGADLTRRFQHVTFSSTPCEPLREGAAAERIRDVGRVLLAADAFGGSQRLLEMCVEYAKTREQFGVTIGHFQALKHQLASMALDVEPNRGLYWFAAYAQDHSNQDTPGEPERIAAIARAHISDRFMQVARDAVEAHGGIGFTWECDVQIWFKRAMFDRAFLGTPAQDRERSLELAGL
ncbi:MAG TPA: acyl-CoA dehydrogenase [Myxococcales bacterium]|nr:acyl-CoA dehydrogenase [Myxococcales bacterium]HIL80201.1 acyl-CoA dehydrogenase [Myxococcales bacterium]